MISRILHIAFYYLSVMPLVAFLLFKFLPAGELNKARLAMVGILIMLALPLRLILKTIPTQPIKLNRNHAWFAVVLTFGSAFLLWRISQHTQGMTDAWQMWNMKGKFYFLSFVNGVEFRLVLPEWFHPGYPAFFPFQLAGIALLLGTWVSEVAIFVALLYYALIALMFFDLAGRIQGARPFWPTTLGDISLLLAILLPVLPGIIMATAEQCADIPLGVFLLYAYYLTRELTGSGKGSVGLFALLGLSFAVMLHVKNEGVLLVLMVFPAFLWLFRSSLKSLKHTAMLLGSFGLSFVLLVLFKVHAPELQPYKFQLSRVVQDLVDLSRYAFILKGFLAFQILTAFFAPIAAAILVFQFRKKDLFLLVPLLLNFAFYHAFFLITPEDLPWHWISAYHRINIQVMPAWFFVSAASLGGLLLHKESGNP
ncbi:MAG: hypothetical protein JNM27_00340 [Leptospirales bacterium]|nr:hypothetical protein [Leptospirales bacterium]